MADNMRLPFWDTDRIAFNSNVDSPAMNKILAQSDENDRFLFGLLVAALDKGSEYSILKTYRKYDTIKKEKKYYMSLQDENLNNDVTRTDWWWEVLSSVAQPKPALPAPVVAVNVSNCEEGDTVIATASSVSTAASELVWDVEPDTFEVTDGALTGTLGKTIKLKLKAVGFYKIRAKVRTTEIATPDSGYSSPAAVSVRTKGSPAPVIRDTSLYHTQTWEGVKFEEPTKTTAYFSYDEIKNSTGNNVVMHIKWVNGTTKSGKVTFKDVYLGKEFIISYEGFDYVGTFRNDTTDSTPLELTKRGTNIQPKQRPANIAEVTWTAKIEHQGYDSGIGYTDPIMSKTVGSWLYFNKKAWDNSIPAEIMMASCDGVKVKFDYAGEYTGDPFEIELKDKSKKWRGVFQVREDFSNPVVLERVV